MQYHWAALKTRVAGAPEESATPPGWVSGVAFQRLAVALLLLVPAAIYANTLDNGYHLDDEYRIVKNLELERVWPPWRHFFDSSTGSALPSLVLYRPLLPLSLSVNHWLSDTANIERIAGLHIGNIILHSIAAVLLFFLSCRVLEYLEAPLDSETRARASLVTALLFVVHPVSGVPVNYLSKRDLLIMALFSAAALLVYVDMRLRGGVSMGSLAAFAVLFALALLGRHEAVAVLPVCIALELLAPESRRDRWRPAAILVLSTALAIAALSRISWLAERASLDYALVQLEVHLRYLGSLLWPFGVRLLPRVSPFESFLDLATAAGLLLVAASVYLAWRWRRSLPAASFCILAYWAFLAPNSTFVRLKELATPYRLYPSLAFFFLLVVLLALTRLRPALVYVTAGALTLFLASSAVAMNSVWQNARTMGAQHERYGGTATAHLNYALSLWSSDPRRAEENLRIAAALEPDNVYVLINLGLFELQTGAVESGLGKVERAVAIAPQLAIAHHWLASAYRQAGRLDEADAQTLIAANLAPGNVEYQYAAARQLQERGDFGGSIRFARRVARLAPGYEDSRLLLGLALDRTGRWQSAEAAYRRFLERRPEHTRARLLLASGLLENGHRQEAIEEFETFARLVEGLSISPDVHCWLARFYREAGDAGLAARHAESATSEPCPR